MFAFIFVDIPVYVNVPFATHTQLEIPPNMLCTTILLVSQYIGVSFSSVLKVVLKCVSAWIFQSLLLLLMQKSHVLGSVT